MPRPRRAVRPVEKTINLPEDLVGKVDLILWSELEERVPHGAWARHVEELLRKDLEERARFQELRKEAQSGRGSWNGMKEAE
jgi:hypothetical protein